MPRFDWGWRKLSEVEIDVVFCVVLSRRKVEQVYRRKVKKVTATCKTSLQTIIVSNKNRFSSIELLFVH